MEIELILFAVWCFLMAMAGGLVGLVLGNTRLPATLIVSSSVAAGTGANLIISAVAAATAAVTHIRAGRVNWKLFAWMAPPSIAFGFAGGYLSGELPRRALLIVIAVVLAQASYTMFRFKPRAPSAGAEPAADDDEPFDKRAALLTGAGVGFLGGVVGLILGSLRMPAMIKYVHIPAARAAGTNLTVGFFVGVAGALGHLPSQAPDWNVALVGGLASIPGAIIGSRLTGKLSEKQLIRALAWILLAVTISILVEVVRG